MTMVLNKKRRLSISNPPTEEHRRRNWSELNTDLLELILDKLSFLDIIQFKDVCSSWKLAAKSRLFSSPWLMVNKPKHGFPTTSRRFFSLKEKKAYDLFKNRSSLLLMLYDFPKVWTCVGSSHGWLVIMDSRANLLLLNPFTQRKLPLPSMKNSLIGSISKAIFIISSEENKEKNKTWVVVIYGLLSKNLAYCNIGDESWNDLKARNLSYCDILGHNGRLYALSRSNTVEVWDFESCVPTKVMKFIPNSQPCLGLDDGKFLKDKYFGQSYLAESMGEFLLVTRIVGNYVNSYGELLDEGDLLTDDSTEPLVCPYRTVAFRVHKMDLEGNNWEKVESLGDQALFVGGNESLSFSNSAFPECEKNSIYFTDDNWDEMDLDYLYGGHDNGVYSLDTQAFKTCFEFDDDKVDPPPFWIVPTV